MDARVALVVALLAVAVAVGLWRRRADGRPRAVEGAVLPAADLGAELGRRATLVQFSSVTCAPCRTARRVLSRVAELTPGVALVEVDVDDRLDLVRALHIGRLPTMLVLDPAGRVVRRAGGVPTEAQVREALAAATGDDHVHSPR